MTKRIPLSNGKYAIVSACDYEYLCQYNWFFDGTYGCHNTSRKHGTKRKIYMHHAILERMGVKRKRGQHTDHINGNALDNTRSNLRVLTHSQNLHNTGKQKGNTSSKYKGVYFAKDCNRWVARIMVNRKLYRLGSFLSEDEAALAYNDAAKRLLGSIAVLNEV